MIQVAITKVCSFSDHLLSYDWHTFLYVSSPSITKLKTFKTSVHLAWPTNKKHAYQKKKKKTLPIYFSHKFLVTKLSPALSFYSIKMMKLEGLPGEEPVIWLKRCVVLLENRGDFTLGSLWKNCAGGAVHQEIFIF